MATVKILYDDDRMLAFDGSFNGEVAIRLGGQDPVFVFAEDLLVVVKEACADAAFFLEGGSWCRD